MPVSRNSEFSYAFGSTLTNAAVLAAAVALGGWLRLRGLGASDMTADEASQWLAASAPSVGSVIRQALQLNPGKLAAHDVTLHFWMLAFGDSIASIRALSAILGTLAIALVFLVTRELFAGDEETSPLFMGDGAGVAALGASVFALNVVAIRYSREGRMYELMLDATLMQLWFFLRAVRHGRLVNYAGTAAFAVLAIAASFVAALVFLAEAMGLLYALRPGASRWPFSWNVAVSLMLAGAIVACLTPWHLWVEEASFFSWIKPGFLTDYVIKFLRPALQSPILYVTLALAAWGVIRGWQKYTEAVSFALLWMLVPLFPLALWLGTIMLLVVTIYSWTPVFADRWALTCIVPLCVLVGLGIWELRTSSARIAAVTLVVVLAGIRIHSYDPNSGDVEWGVQWRAATAAALPELKAGKPVNVVPGYAMYVVRYYLRNYQIDPALLSEDNRQAQVVILADTAESLLPAAFSTLHRHYPSLRAQVRGVSVLATPFAVGPPGEIAPRAQ